MKTVSHYLPLLALSLCLGACGETPSGYYDPSRIHGAPIRHQEILSDPYAVDDLFRSMEGPSSRRQLPLYEVETPELLWITGYRAEIVDQEGVNSMPQEFMCHSNLDFDVDRHSEIFGGEKTTSNRLFTLSQGQFSIEFPVGFGIPILSSETLSLSTQVLNLNIDDADLVVRHKITIDFVRDQELDTPMKPLFLKSANGLVSLEEDVGYYDVAEPDALKHGPGCLVGQAASGHVRTDDFDRKFAGHWVVKPGREVNRTLVTEWMNMQFDTTVHYIAVHLHPFAESLELVDLTTGETVFKSKARNFDDKIGLEEVEFFSSEEGLPIYEDHEYELVSTYFNTTDVDQDSMAVIFMYVMDPEFVKPDLSRLSD
ncbi:MAG: hypothetical protein E2P02_16575 [Acidobacteria bacterium]|nr:MAG: hypothetical protein E2P02_16575 [Acidobacteriota bacterium]